MPAISRDLAPTAAQQLWIIDAYPLVLAGLLVGMGSAGDRYGRRRMLLVGSIGFTVLSVAAAFAPTAEALIAARAALGFFGAMLMPSTLSLLRTVFTDREQRRLAIAIWASGFAAGAALGPIVGGVLLEHFHWGSVFLLAVPVLVPMLILVPLLIPESRDPAPGRVDLVSTLLSLAAMGPVVYGIKSLATEGFTAVGAAMIVLGLAAGAWFVHRQLRSSSPMLDIRLFRQGSFGGAVLINLFSVIALVGFLFFVSQHLQLIAGLTPVAAGMALLPGLVAMIVAGLVVVPIARRVRPRVLVPVALGLSAAGYALIAFTANADSIAPVVIAFVLLGVGIGAAETVSNELILSSAPAGEGGCRISGLRDGVRARRRARNRRARIDPRGALSRRDRTARRADGRPGRDGARDARGRCQRGRAASRFDRRPARDIRCPRLRRGGRRDLADRCRAHGRRSDHRCGHAAQPECRARASRGE